MSSNRPVATVTLWKYTAWNAIQATDHAPNTRPMAAESKASPAGMRYSSTATSSAVIGASAAESHADRRRTPSVTSSTTIGDTAGAADSHSPPAGW